MITAAVSAAVLVLCLLVMVWPAPHRELNFAAFTPPEWVDLRGPFAPNDLLARHCKPLAKGRLHGPETAAPSADGKTLYFGEADGWVRKIDVASGGQARAEAVAYVGGRPLGLVANGTRLFIADPVKGLLELDMATGALAVLCNHIDGVPLLYADDVDIGPRTGKLYFSDASTIAPWRNAAGEWETMQASTLEFLEARKTGRLIEYDPASRTARVLAADLFFANGVAVSRDESYVVVAETFTARLLKVWLAGPKAGRTEQLVALPGYPDGMSRGNDDTFWVAIASPRIDAERFQPYPLAKRLVAQLPVVLRPKAVPYGLVIQVRGSDGAVLQALHDPSGTHVNMPTSVEQLDDTTLALGHLHGDAITLCTDVPHRS